jgi:hypothetical protein
LVTPVLNSPWGSRALTGVAGLAVVLARAARHRRRVVGLARVRSGPVAFVPAAVQEPALVLLASGLFAAPAAAPATPDAPARAVGGDMRLLGVLAEDGGRASHCSGCRRDRSSLRRKAHGDDVSLVSVERDGVTVRDANGERRMLLRAVALPACPRPRPRLRRARHLPDSRAIRCASTPNWSAASLRSRTRGLRLRCRTAAR